MQCLPRPLWTWTVIFAIPTFTYGQLCSVDGKADVNGDCVVDPLDTGYVGSRLGCDVGVPNPDCAAADVNLDGNVDPLDTGFVLARLGCLIGSGDTNCDQADANTDGIVDPLDTGYILARFGCVPKNR